MLVSERLDGQLTTWRCKTPERRRWMVEFAPATTQKGDMRVRLPIAVLVLVALVLTSVVSAQEVQPVLKVAPGFAVERVYSVPRETQGSWISLCADSRGVLYASDQLGPLYRIEIPAAAGKVAVRALDLPIGGVHGMSYVGGALYAVVGQKEVCQPGLYRLRDTDNDGELDSVQLLRALNGEGEHGPHAVAASPDGKSLFVIAGNATALPELAGSRSPEELAERFAAAAAARRHRQ